MQRVDCKDYLSLTACSSWRTFHRSATNTSDLAGLAWSPDSTCLAAWDTSLSYKVLLFGRDGSPRAAYSACPGRAGGCLVPLWAGAGCGQLRSGGRAESLNCHSIPFPAE